MTVLLVMVALALGLAGWTSYRIYGRRSEVVSMRRHFHDVGRTGHGIANPARAIELLGPGEARQVLREIADRYDGIVYDGDTRFANVYRAQTEFCNEPAADGITFSASPRTVNGHSWSGGGAGCPVFRLSGWRWWTMASASCTPGPQSGAQRAIL